MKNQTLKKQNKEKRGDFRFSAGSSEFSERPDVKTPEERDKYKEFVNDVLHKYNDAEECELKKMLGDPTTDLCQCLTFLMNKKGWNKAKDFAEHTGLNSAYFSRISNSSYNHMGKKNLLSICVGLGLPLRIILDLFEKSEVKFQLYQDPDKTYARIIESKPGISLDDFDAILEEAGYETLGIK